jgi:oligopeptide/dipeptide ABC transporter ATP-binding protein
MEKQELQPLLEVRGLKKDFVSEGAKGKKVVHALSGIDFTVRQGETFGLVGESGCGKTTVGRVICCLTEPTEGEVLFEGKDLFKMSRAELKKVRRDIQMIFQDPFASLDPRMTIGQIITEPLIIHKIGDRASRRAMAEELLERVGLQPSYYNRYPHEFSGGQRQRIGIARALILKPKLVICDEPVSALDVSVQSQILNLLKELQKDMGLTYIFIAHGLNVVKHISDRVGVMYLGRMAEVVEAEDLFHSPAHPYTQALLSAIPHPDPTREQHRIILEGDIPSPVNPPSGCYFHTRCHHCGELCACEVPQMQRIGEREVACHYPLLK